MNIHLYNEYHRLNGIHLYNEYHLGDCVWNILYLNKIKEFIEQNNITLNFYINEIYIKQILEFVMSKNIKILPLNLLENKQNATNIWVGNNRYKHYIWNMHMLVKNKTIGFNNFLTLFHKEIFESLNLSTNFTDYIYKDPELLTRYENLNEKYKNVDFLIVNSKPLSYQYTYNQELWNTLLDNLMNLNFNVVTTLKHKTLKCTMDDDLTIKDIAAISTHSKNIIAIATGPLPGLVNEYTLNFVNSFFIVDDDEFMYFNYSKCKNITNLQTLIDYIDLL